MAKKETRKFDGKTYTLEDWFLSKTAAKVVVNTLRLLDYNVRITFKPKSKRPGGYPLTDLWYVWKRKADRPTRRRK